MRLKEIIWKIKDFITEGRLVFDKNSLKITEMDPANVALVILDYKIKTEISGEFPVNINTFANILKGLDSDPEFFLEKENKKIILKEGRHIFDLNILEGYEGQLPKIPNFDFSGQIVEIKSEDFCKAILNAYSVGESIIFSIKGISGEGDASGYNWNYGMFDKAKYSGEYLSKMTFEKLKTNVKIEYKKDYPMLITYFQLDSYKLQFILAPRTEN